MKEQWGLQHQAFLRLAEQGAVDAQIIELAGSEKVIYPAQPFAEQFYFDAPDRKYRVFSRSDETALRWVEQADLAAELLGDGRGWTAWMDALFCHASPDWREIKTSPHRYASLTHVAYRSAELALELSKKKPTKRRGRPPATTAERKEQKKIAEVWQAGWQVGNYRTYEDLAKVYFPPAPQGTDADRYLKQNTLKVKRAVDNHRKK